MRCPACGVEVVEQAVFCHKCGEPIAPGEGDFPDPPRSANGLGTAETFRNSVEQRRNDPNPPEEELWRGGYSSKAMLGAWVASGLVDVGLLVAGVFWVRQAAYWLILLVAMLLPWLYNFVVLCYRRMNVRYMLTTQRFVHESGVLRRVTDRVEVLDMDDITFEQGILERPVGVGTIRIVSSDRSHPELSLPGIENVKNVAKQFDDARLLERRRRGLHIEQI